MGFWQGIYEAELGIIERKTREKELQQARDDRARERQEDRDDANTRFNREILERRRDATLQLAIDAKARREALAQQVDAATSYGLSEFTAKALLSSGQLGLFLTNAEKQGVDRKYISDLNTVVEAKFRENPEVAAKVMLVGSQNSAAGGGDEEKTFADIAQDILSATSQEELMSVGLNIGAPNVPAIPRLDVNLFTVGGAEPADTKAIRREIAERINPYVGNTFAVDANGELVATQNTKPEVISLFNKLETFARDQSFGPQAAMSPTDAAAFVVSQIESAIDSAGTFDIVEAANKNFSLLMTDPKSFASTIAATPQAAVVPTGTPEAAVGNMADQAIRGSNIPTNTISNNEEQDENSWVIPFEGLGQRQ